MRLAYVQPLTTVPLYFGFKLAPSVLVEVVSYAYAGYCTHQCTYCSQFFIRGEGDKALNLKALRMTRSVGYDIWGCRKEVMRQALCTKLLSPHPVIPKCSQMNSLPDLAISPSQLCRH